MRVEPGRTQGLTALKEVCCGSNTSFQVETPENHFLSGTSGAWEQPRQRAGAAGEAGGHKRALSPPASQVTDTEAPSVVQSQRKDSANVTRPGHPCQAV